ncbi:hypothetical protein JCM19233_1800 [Vibrio astriarenae]|nr:hypothetical protein JCM19233_1800 [Vibrio sp. C7]
MSWSHSTARATGDTLTREDVLNSLSGLKGEAMLWASLCYINHGDSKALATLTSRLAKLLSRRYPDIKPKVLVG